MWWRSRQGSQLRHPTGPHRSTPDRTARRRRGAGRTRTSDPVTTTDPERTDPETTDPETTDEPDTTDTADTEATTTTEPPPVEPPRPVVLIAEVGRITQDNDSPVPSFVGAIRCTRGRLRDEFSTVDNAETVLGWIAIVLGLDAASAVRSASTASVYGADRAVPRTHPMTDVAPATAGTAGADSAHRAGRDALVLTICTFVVALTGFVRVLVAVACLGVGVLGDTYGVANTVPNLLFELLLAGGVLQAVLVPVFVAARRDGGDEGLGHAAGAVLGWLSSRLLVVVTVGLVASPLVAWLLTLGEDDADVAHDKRTLVGRMLIVFVPQVLCYGFGMVATAALAARRHFVAAALAPAVNNVIVIICYGLYRASLDGAEPSLHMSEWQFALVVGGRRRRSSCSPQYRGPCCRRSVCAGGRDGNRVAPRSRPSGVGSAGRCCPSPAPWRRPLRRWSSVTTRRWRGRVRHDVRVLRRPRTPSWPCR